MVKRSAFSLLELLISIVILAMISVVCGFAMLNFAKQLSFEKQINDKTCQIALLQIQNLLQNALPDSISIDNKPLDSTFHSGILSFIGIDMLSLSGIGTKQSPSSTLQNNMLLPKQNIIVDSANGNELFISDTFRFAQFQKLYLLPQNPTQLPIINDFYQSFFAPNPTHIFYINQITKNSILLNATPTFTPFIAIPIESAHHIRVLNNILLLDDEPLCEQVSAFSITPHKLFNNELFLELNLCHHNNKICESGAAHIESIIEYL